MMIIAKFKDKIVQIVRIADVVQFSKDTEWILICFDFDKPVRKRDHIKWINAKETRVEWIREFIGE